MRETNASSRAGCGGTGLFTVVSLWVVVVSTVVHAGAWFLDQAFLIEGIPLPSVAWLFIQWGQAVLLAIPVLPLALRAGSTTFGIAYRLWAAAIGYLALMALVRVVPGSDTQIAWLLQFVLNVVVAVAVVLAVRRQGHPVRWAWLPAAAGLTAGALFMLPWLAYGALGSPLDAILNLLSAGSFGALVGLLVWWFVVLPLGGPGQLNGRRLIFGGFAVSVALAVIGSGFGFYGSQLLLLVCLPPAGFALVAAARFARDEETAWLPGAMAAAIAVLGPTAFYDPKELTLLLGLPGDGEVLDWALRAAALAGLLSLLVAFALFWQRRRAQEQPARGPAWATAAVTCGAAALVYFLAGQPGFYGDGVFVILREQADLSGAASIGDRTQRLTTVYRQAVATAERSQAGLRADLASFHIPFRPYYLVNGIAVDTGPFVRAYLSTRPEVDRVLDSARLRPLPHQLPQAHGDQPAPTAPPWNITSIGADRVWKELGVTGKGIVVGQSDSGVQGDHPALRDGYRGRNGDDDYNWLDPWSGNPSPIDFGGHGTHTLGSVLGRTGIGVAPDAEWFACVNLERNIGNPGEYLNCMQFMLAPYPRGGDPFRDGDPTRAAHVINNSWGCPPLEGCDANALLPAADALRAAGIYVVASAGNEGPFCGSVSDPIAIYGSVFSVGAVDEAGNVATFSSRGPVRVDDSNRPKPDILAPGVDVLSSFPSSTYQREQGTSMAGPHVVGVVALMWSANPKLVGDIDGTTRILRETARPYQGTQEGCFTGGTPNDAYGYGLVDAYAAVKRAQEAK